jgi:hypothetical protein
MSTYYCHRCARSAGHVTPVTPPAAPGGQYQLDKYIKHTQPTDEYPVNSVFSDPSWGGLPKSLGGRGRVGVPGN